VTRAPSPFIDSVVQTLDPWCCISIGTAIGIFRLRSFFASRRSYCAQGDSVRGEVGLAAVESRTLRGLNRHKSHGGRAEAMPSQDSRARMPVLHRCCGRPACAFAGVCSLARECRDPSLESAASPRTPLPQDDRWWGFSGRRDQACRELGASGGLTRFGTKAGFALIGWVWPIAPGFVGVNQNPKVSNLDQLFYCS